MIGDPAAAKPLAELLRQAPPVHGADLQARTSIYECSTPRAEAELLAEAERIGREDIFLPWVRLLAAKLPGTRFKAFTLRVPFSELRITPPDSGESR